MILHPPSLTPNWEFIGKKKKKAGLFYANYTNYTKVFYYEQTTIL